MRALRVVSILVAILLVVVILGHWSGTQPDRDEVSAAQHELGIPLESRRVDVGNVTLHVVLAGPAEGPPVVLLHGFPEFWYAWRGPLAVLARAGFRVIVPDQRGYNRSDKPDEVSAYGIDLLGDDIVGLIDALGHKRVYLAGHDWGGGVAWNVALRYPDRVERLAILDTPHPQSFEDYEAEGDEETITWFRTFIQLPWLPGWSSRVANWKLLVANLRGTSRPGTFPDEVMDLYRSAWDRDGAMVTMSDWYRAAFRDPKLFEGEQRVSIPTLVILAPDDAFIPSGLTRASMRFLDRGKLVELDAGTHWVIQEDPERIGALLVEFFSGA